MKLEKLSYELYYPNRREQSINGWYIRLEHSYRDYEQSKIRMFICNILFALKIEYHVLDLKSVYFRVI